MFDNGHYLPRGSPEAGISVTEGKRPALVTSNKGNPDCVFVSLRANVKGCGNCLKRRPSACGLT